MEHAHGETVGVAGARRTDEEGHLELKVEEPARSKDGRLLRVGPLLASGPAERRARDDDARGPAVVADGKMEPVGQQCVVGIPEHRSDVGGVLA